MDIGNSPLLSRMKHSQNAPQESHHMHVPGSLLFPRIYRTEAVVPRSPFSRLANQGCNNQAPVKMINDQSQNYSENTGSSFEQEKLPLVSTTSARMSLRKVHPLQRSFTSNQTQLGQRVTTSYAPKSGNISYLAANITEGCYSQSCAALKEPILDVFNSTGRAHCSWPIKKETDETLSRLTDAKLRSSSCESSTISPFIRKGSPRRSATPYSHVSVTDGEGELISKSKSIRPPLMYSAAGYIDYFLCRLTLPSTEEQANADLPTLMFKGATDLRNAQLELEEKVRCRLL